MTTVTMTPAKKAATAAPMIAPTGADEAEVENPLLSHIKEVESYREIISKRSLKCTR